MSKYYEKFTFLDESGQSFAIGSDNSYVFYFDNKISTKLFGIKKIFLVSADEFIPISIEDNQDKILLIDTNNIRPDDLNNYILNNNITLTNNYISKGYKLNVNYFTKPGYLHCLYFVAHCENEDESNRIYQIPFNIYNSFEFQIAAEFEGIDESLMINLQNMGMRISNEISSAINGTNPNEIYPDEILLNNKFKELLSEYMNIIANMGSYDSLLNALKWFGYDNENIKLYEFWQNATSKKYDLSNIETRLYDELNTLIKYYSKSTYIGIFYMLNNIKKIKLSDGTESVVYETENNLNDNGNWKWWTFSLYGSPMLPDSQNQPDYPNFGGIESTERNTYYFGTFTNEKYSNGITIPEPIPVLEDTVWNYTAYDLYLKMCLLSKYYQKYFMPIHLDLYDIVATKAIFNTIKNINQAYLGKTNHINNLNFNSIKVADMPNTYFISECTAWINQSNHWNTFKDYEVKYVGPIYTIANQNGGEFRIFNENTIEYNIPNVFIASDNSKEIQKLDNSSKSGLNGFYIITDCGVKIPLSFEYNENNLYSKFELYVYFSAKYNVEWPKDWSIEHEGFNRYYFEKKVIDNPLKPIDEPLQVFVNRQGHYMFQAVFTDYYGSQTIVNKEIDVKPSKINFDIFRLVPQNIDKPESLKVFEGINFVSKKELNQKLPDENYIGYAVSGEPVKGSYTFDFYNHDYSNDSIYDELNDSKYSSELFFFTNTEDKNNQGILLTNHIIFIKLNELYGKKINYNGVEIINYIDNTQFYGKDSDLIINNIKCSSLTSLKNNFDDYMWILKQGDNTFGEELPWNTVIIGISKNFGIGNITAESLKESLTGKFEWYSQQRFILDMYTLEKINENQEISPYTLVYLKPDIDNTYFALDSDGKILPKWTIKNESVIYNKLSKKYEKQTVKKKTRNNYIFSPYNEIYHYNAEPGYYSISFQCRFVPDGTNIEINKKNYLCVKKEVN